MPAASSARAANARCSPAISRMSASIASRTQRRKSTATWSLRERAVCSLPATGPTMSASRLSTFIWMSSSAREKGNFPASISPLTSARPLAMASASAASTIPWRASMATWAREPAISWAASLRSKSIEALIASMISAGPTANRPPHIALLIDVALDGSRMTMTGYPPPRSLLPAGIGVVAAAVAVAFLYATLEPPDKAAGACPAASRALAAKLAPLARGEVAAVAIAEEPRQALPLAFERADGSKATLADFRGRAVLLNLWATWCVPCRAEMPALDRLQAEAGDPAFEVVAVNVDTARLERRGPFLDGIGVKALARYADPSGDAFETLRKDGKALGLPVTLLIDRAGCEIGSAAGAVKWDSADAQALIGALKGG